MPKKWPASVDLQAFKNSKGLQEQQSQSQSNTPAPHFLTISMKRIRTANAPFSAFKCASRNPLLQTILCQGRPEIGLRMAGPNPLSAVPLGKEVKKLVNSQEKRSNRRVESAKASFSILSRASRTSGYRRQFPLHRRSSSLRFPKAPAWSTSAAN